MIFLYEKILIEKTLIKAQKNQSAQILSNLKSFQTKKSKKIFVQKSTSKVPATKISAPKSTLVKNEKFSATSSPKKLKVTVPTERIQIQTPQKKKKDNRKNCRRTRNSYSIGSCSLISPQKKNLNTFESSLKLTISKSPNKNTLSKKSGKRSRTTSFSDSYQRRS